MQVDLREMKLGQRIMSLQSQILNTKLSNESAESLTLNSALAGIDTLYIPEQSTCENKLKILNDIEKTFLKLNDLVENPVTAGSTL